VKNLTKTSICLLLLAVLLQNCGKFKTGKIDYKVKYTTDKSSLKSTKATPDKTYAQFGAYITSLTPHTFTSKIRIMMYLDNWEQSGNSTHMISYVDGHDNDPNYEIATYADFSGNQEVSMDPILYSTDIYNGIFKQKEIIFNYFYFVPYYFTQEFEIPSQYGEIRMINLGGDAIYSVDAPTGKRTCKVNHDPFVNAIYTQSSHVPFSFVFGNTDSTFIFNKECANVPLSENSPFGGSAPIIRSNKYTPLKVTMPSDGESLIMYSTVSFDTENLIQVYAGIDNIPYTSDDVFVYAPDYWERLHVKLEIK
jgi:hypothetical protein